MTAPLPLLPTTLVGSYVQPDWLIDRAKLTGMAPPRVRAKDVWRIPEEHLEDAQDAATLTAIREMELAGLDILTDGEIRRESYFNRFHAALDGIEIDRPAEILGRSGRPMLVPRITGPVRRRHPVEARDAAFLRRGCRPGPSRRGATPSPRSITRCAARPALPRRTSASATATATW